MINISRKSYFQTFQDYGGDLLHFSCSPYYLRLHLTGQVVDFAEGKGHISHDVETGRFFPEICSNFSVIDLAKSYKLSMFAIF